MGHDPIETTYRESGVRPANLQAEEWSIISEVLIPEFRDIFTKWNMEYSTQERDLGIRAEFVNLWRKAKKVKAAVWDGGSDANWREGLRIVLLEIIGHAFLMLFDLDKQAERDIRLQHQAVRAPDSHLVPHCGHARCIEHARVPLYELDAKSKELYRKESRGE